MQISNESKVGAFTAISIAVLIIGFNFLKGNDLLSREKLFLVEYENILGLQASDPVQFNGLTVGRVKSVDLHPTKSDLMLVTLTVRPDIKITKNSIAKIVNSDLLGSKAIAIIVKEGSALAESGDLLLPEVQRDLQRIMQEDIMGPINERVQKLLSSIDSVVIVAGYFLNEKNRTSIDNSFENLEDAIKTLSQTSVKVDQLIASETFRFKAILENLQSITTNFKNNGDKINNLMSNLESISDTLAGSNLAATINSVNQSLIEFTKVLDKVNAGEGNIGLLLKDDKLYNELANSAADLDLLLKDIEENPGRYIRIRLGKGKIEKKAQKAEKKAAKEEQKKENTGGG
ncbi:MAG: MCE family protein [Bacteroidetes bacterium]|nr:MCE family protein [Bacteroidota bacterium]